MTSSFGCPPSGGRPPPVNPTPHDYHHLESNRALPHPLKGPIHSEYHDKHKALLKSSGECLSKRKEAVGERTSRTSHNKDSHFVFGFDSGVPLSEKVIDQLKPVLDAVLNFSFQNISYSEHFN